MTLQSFKFPDDISFANAQEFKGWLSILKEKIAGGELKQFVPDSPFATELLVEDIDINGPWPDFIEWYFESTHNSKRYRLSAEIYHGSGGRWQLIRDGVPRTN